MDLVSIFVSVRACVRIEILDMCGPILFVLGTKTTHEGMYVHIVLFVDAIKDGRLAAILVEKNLMLNTSPTIYWTCTVRFC